MGERMLPAPMLACWRKKRPVLMCPLCSAYGADRCGVQCSAPELRADEMQPVSRMLHLLIRESGQLLTGTMLACSYTSESTAIRHFLEVISELDSSDQRRFLRFVTGSPRLPPGGIAALRPRCAVYETSSSPCIWAL